MGPSSTIDLSIDVLSRGRRAASTTNRSAFVSSGSHDHRVSERKTSAIYVRDFFLKTIDSLHLVTEKDIQ